MGGHDYYRRSLSPVIFGSHNPWAQCWIEDHVAILLQISFTTAFYFLDVRSTKPVPSLMKKISRIIQLLPAAELEKFPTHLQGELAAGILANWTAAWHPLLIAAADAAPVVVSAASTRSPDDDGDGEDQSNGHLDDSTDSNELAENLDGPFDVPYDDEHEYDQHDDGAIFDQDLLPAGSSQRPDDLSAEHDADFWKDSLIFVPEVTLEHIAHGFAARVVSSDAKLITGFSNRDQIIARVAELTQIDLASPPTSSGESSTVGCDDFFALSYAYLQIQLMTRKIRYSSNLNQLAFDQKLIAAANAYAAGDQAQCNAALDACYDMLSQEKNNYYPVRPTLIDLVLTTPTTMDDRFEQEVASNHAVNFMLTGETIDAADDSTVNALKSTIDQQRVAVVGGNQVELPDTLLSPESTLNQLQRGRLKFQDRLQYDVCVFMRQRFGLMSSLPNILNQLDFNGAMHTSLRGGKFPTGSMGTIRWSGDAGVSIIAKAETLLDASDPATMLDLGVKMGKQIDSAHESTCTFAHWPGRCDSTFKDLITVASRSEVLGVFMTLDNHFDNLYDPGYDDNFSSEEYAAPFLDESIAQRSPVPLSTTIHYWQHYFQLHQIEGLVAMLTVETLKAAATLKPGHADRPTEEQPDHQPDRKTPTDSQTFTGTQIQTWIDRCDQWQNQIDAATADWTFDPNTHRKLTQSLDEAQQQLAASISAIKSSPDGEPISSALLNPLFFTRQIFATLPADRSPLAFIKKKRPYLVRQTVDQSSHVGAELKGTSITPIHSTSPDSANDLARSSSPKNAIAKEPAVLDGDKLQNEFFVATIDRKTGALKNLLFHGQRGNRCSQRLIWKDGAAASRSTMVCDTYETSAIGVVGGEIKTSGRIVANDKTVANFTQTFRLNRGQSVLTIDIDLQPAVNLGHTKQNYFAHRVAWRDEACKIFGSDQFVRTELYAPKLQSPNFVQIENLDYSLTLLSSGLAYHNRIDRRQMDTLLITGGETRRKFRLGLGIDLKYPLKSAIDFVTPVLWMPSDPSMASQASQYFHLDSKNILMTRVRPLFDDAQNVIGFDFRFQETQRRSGEANLYCPFKIAQADRTDFNGSVIETLSLPDSPNPTRIPIPFAAADFFQIRVLIEPTS